MSERDFAGGECLMASQTQIEALNLSYSYTGYWSDILAGVGSVDSTGNYVFPVPPERVYKGGARVSVYWLTAGGFDTMYTIWNPQPDAQDVLVTLKYGTKGETYKLPLTLEPYASKMIDIGEMIRTRQLDQGGRILPADVTQGSVLVSSPANDLADAIAVVLSGGIYNPTKATCSPPCQVCQGFTNIECTPSQTQAQFESQVYSVGQSQGAAIVAATEYEDCNQDVRLDASCVFRGFINWPTYATCQ
jgi:hypothetical protein